MHRPSKAEHRVHMLRRGQHWRLSGGEAAGGLVACTGPVGALDQVVGGVVGLELRQADGDRSRRGFLGEHRVGMRQALGDSVLAEAGDHAHELIASEANGQVVWPELGLQRLGDIVQQPVAGGVTTPVVDDLERIDVDERDDQRLTAAPGPAQVTLKLQQTGPTQVGPGELIQGGRPSICGRVTAVVQSMSAVQDRGSACIIASPRSSSAASLSCSEALRSEPL